MKKRRSQIKRCDNKIITNESRLVTTKDDSVDDPQQQVHIPDEVFLEHILTRLPLRTLKDLSSVSKLWYNSIYKDPRFPSSHFLQSKKNPILMFHLLNSAHDTLIPNTNFIFSIDLDGAHYDYRTLANNLGTQDDNLVLYKNSSFGSENELEFVNYCNGLGCFTMRSRLTHVVNFVIQNPCWGLELLGTTCPNRNRYTKSCCGFGFDSLTNEYKVVTVLCSNSQHSIEQLFKGMVYTLGARSWRETDCSELVAGSGIRMSRMSFTKCAIFVGGFLFWRIFSRGVDNGEEREMLLLFDLHDEKFQFVGIPAECAATTKAERMQVVDHLLVIKGSPCVVVVEKLILTEGHHVNHHPQQHKDSPLCCCCCCKIHLYVLKDIIKQVWIKETIDVCTTTLSSSSWLSPAGVCCCCLDGTASPPTRILSFSDRVLLYWFDGSCLRLFDPWKNNHKMVKCSHDQRKLFEHTMKGWGRHIQDDIGNHAVTANATIYFRDVQLVAVAENFISFRAFVPEGAKSTANALDLFRSKHRVYIWAMERSGLIAHAL